MTSSAYLATSRWTFTSATVLFAALFIILRFFPAFLLELIGLTPTADLNYFATRAGYLFLGFAVLSFYSRRLTDGPALKAIATAYAVMFIGLVASGIQGYATGLTNTMIFAPIAIEAIFALLYFRLATASFR